jgi:DNA mismatch endonuclease (patch repair protein)
MAKIRRRDTTPELRLRSALWKAGIRGWRCDVARLPGRPDLAFTKLRVAIFVDGLLWHGHPSKYPAGLSDPWRAKIERNVDRDRSATASLEALGWQVVRLWDLDIRKRLPECVAMVRNVLEASRASESR